MFGGPTPGYPTQSGAGRAGHRDTPTWPNIEPDKSRYPGEEEEAVLRGGSTPRSTGAAVAPWWCSVSCLASHSVSAVYSKFADEGAMSKLYLWLTNQWLVLKPSLQTSRRKTLSKQLHFSLLVYSIRRFSRMRGTALLDQFDREKHELRNQMKRHR